MYHVHTITILHTFVCIYDVQPVSCSLASRLWWEQYKWHDIYTGSDTYNPTNSSTYNTISVADRGNWCHDYLSRQWLYHQLSAILANDHESQ